MNSIRETYPDSASDSEAGDELSDHEDHSETFTVPLPPPFTGSAHLTGDILESLVVKKFGASVVLQEADADSDASSGVSDTSIRTTQSSVSTATQRPSSPYQGFLAAKKVVPTKHSVDIKSLPLPSASSVQKVGTVRSILDNVIVVEADRGSPTLDLDTIMFLGQAPLGRVFDVFGPVIRPLYSIRFESADEVAVTTASVGAEIFVVPTDPRLTSFVFVEDLRRHRGTDASWEDNTELPNEMEEFSDDEKEQQHRQHAQRQKRHHSNTKAIPNSVIPRHPKPDARNTETGSETPVTHGSSQYYSRVPQERMESRHLPHPVEWENAPRPTNLHFRPFPPFTCGLRPTFTEMPPPRFGGSPFNHRSFTSHEPRRTMPLPPLRNEFFRVPGPAIPPPFLPLSDLYPQPCLQDVPREPSFQDTLVALKPGLISQEATKVTDSEVKDCAPLVTSPKLLPEAHSLFYDPKTAHALSEVRPRFPPKGFMGI